MTTTLVLTGSISAKLFEKTNLAVESAGVILARLHKNLNGDFRLLAREVCWVPDTAYRRRTNRSMSISSDGYVGALNLAQLDGSVPIWFHTHPGKDSIPLPSLWDEKVIEEISDLFRMRSETECFGTLITSPKGNLISFSGSLQIGSSEPVSIDRIWIVGDYWRMISAYDSKSAEVASNFDRNVRAFGSAIQRSIGTMRIAIVGAGGTGSSVAEQLVRLGARHLILVDPDYLEESNVTRVYGSTLEDVGKPKVTVLKDYLKKIAPELECQTIESKINFEQAARAISGIELIFGCTDDNAGRLVLSRISTYFLVPVIDLGVLLSSKGDGVLVGIDGRVTTIYPGSACLICRQRIDLAGARAELKNPEERNRLINEGYAPALNNEEPAVVSFTTLVASVAVSEFLERLIGYGPAERPSEILLRMHEREISTNVSVPLENHYCHSKSGKWGIGEEDPYLGVAWSM